MEQHRKIFDYIKQRDEEQASNEMIKHLEMDVAHLMEVLNEEKSYSEK